MLQSQRMTAFALAIFRCGSEAQTAVIPVGSTDGGLVRSTDFGDRISAFCAHIVNHVVPQQVMLQVWKIVVPANSGQRSSAQGWAVASSAEEAIRLSGNPKSIVSPDPERLWIAKERVVWERPFA